MKKICKQLLTHIHEMWNFPEKVEGEELGKMCLTRVHTDKARLST
jgi:hypothetical protein